MLHDLQGHRVSWEGWLQSELIARRMWQMI